VSDDKPLPINPDIVQRIAEARGRQLDRAVTHIFELEAERDRLQADLERQGAERDRDYQRVVAERDRLRHTITGAVLALETVLVGDHVDMNMPAIEVLGRAATALKQSIGGRLSMRPPAAAEEKGT
jgi:hypothetical protein